MNHWLRRRKKGFTVTALALWLWAAFGPCALAAPQPAMPDCPEMAAGTAVMALGDVADCAHLSSSLDCHVPDNDPLAQAGALVVGAFVPPLIRLVPVSLDLESSSFERHVLAAVTVPRPPLNLQNAVLLI